jgi:hypothetical protein
LDQERFVYMSRNERRRLFLIFTLLLGCAAGGLSGLLTATGPGIV